jgi:ATP-dependent DNA helicase RecG
MLETFNIIKEGENTKVEFKEKMNDSAYKTLSAFANTDGGILLCGVSDNGIITGTDCSNENIRDIIGKIVSTMGINPSVNSVEDGEKRVLKIEIGRSGQPVSYRGKYYKRVGNTTREMQGEELVTFFQQWSNWDTLTGEYNIDEIDESTVNTFIKTGLNNGRLKHIDENGSLNDKLQQLGVLKKGKLTNAAIILFGKNPQEHFINAIVRIVRFKNDTTIIGDTIVEGNLFQQAKLADDEINRNINVAYVIDDNSFSRKNVWDYPLVAIREALMNAIVHRDYFKSNVQTQIKIFDDHIRIFNVGGLPEGITIEELKEIHTSVPRNPLIVSIFYRAGFIEELGSGIKRIIESLNDAGLPNPEFKEEAGGFSIYLWERYSKKDLNERQEKALDYLLTHEKITNKEYRTLNPKITRQTATKELKDLVDKGITLAKGKGKNTYYTLIRS